MADFAGQYDGLRIFSATMAGDRERLGERVNKWVLLNKKSMTVVNTIVLQSSDNAFHCISITIFYTGEAKVELPEVPGKTRDMRPGGT